MPLQFICTYTWDVTFLLLGEWSHPIIQRAVLTLTGYLCAPPPHQHACPRHCSEHRALFKMTPILHQMIWNHLRGVMVRIQLRIREVLHNHNAACICLCPQVFKANAGILYAIKEIKKRGFVRSGDGLKRKIFFPAVNRTSAVQPVVRHKTQRSVR
jgi:hypothetical protein